MNSKIKALQDKQALYSYYTGRAFKAFAFMTLTAIVFIVFTCIGTTVGIKGLLCATASLFYAVFCRCVSFTVCAGTESADLWNNLTHHLQVHEAVFFWIGLGVFGTGILKVIIKALILLLNDRRFIKSISTVSLDEYPRHKATLSTLGLLKSFVLFRGDNLKYSFTLGMWKPRIYMSTGTYSYLTDEEFLSAVLHEDHHRRYKDPLRLFIVTVLRELLFFLPISSYLTRVFLDAKEKAADDNAVYESGKPLELASAIVKLVRPAHGLSHAYLANSVSGMDAVEERVRRLIDPGLEITNKKPSRKNLFFTMGLSAFFFGAIFVNGLVLYGHREKVAHCASYSCSMKCSTHASE